MSIVQAMGAPGAWPVMLTPYKDDLRIDWTGLDALTDWYLASGVAGLFSVCLSSDMYRLSDDERLGVARRVVRKVGGRVPVVAGGTFDRKPANQVDMVREMYDTGVTSVVLIVNQFAATDEGTTVWQANVSRLLDAIPDVPLGLYECPAPYHRLLTPEEYGWAGHTGRFVFHKDTCCRMAPIRAKIDATKDTPLAFYNAHTPTLLDSIRAGGEGYCGTAANVYPELLAWLCTHAESDPQEAERLQNLLGVCDRAVAHKYHALARAYLRRQGLPIGPRARGHDEELAEPDVTVLTHLEHLVAITRSDLGITTPIAGR